MDLMTNVNELRQIADQLEKENNGVIENTEDVIIPLVKSKEEAEGLDLYEFDQYGRNLLRSSQ